MTTIDLEHELGDVLGLAATVHGWLTPAEGALLFRLARHGTPGRGVIVEIGSWKGKSTIFLARGSLSGPRLPVFAIDPHTGSAEQRALYGEVGTFEEFQRTIRRARVEGVVRPHVATSLEAARLITEPVQLLFIDGAHDYDSVCEDFAIWSPRVIDGGFIAFHDSRKPGPRQLIREGVLSSRHYDGLHAVDSMTVVRKVGCNRAVDRLRNHVAFRTYLLTGRVP